MRTPHAEALRAGPGPGRRDFLRFGALAALEGPSLLAAPAARVGGFGRARKCVLLFLTGGPPQHDTFDPKPDVPAEGEDEAVKAGSVYGATAPGHGRPRARCRRRT